VIAFALNAIGLVLGMAGVVVLFIWGPPQPLFTEDDTDILVSKASNPDANKAEKRRYMYRSRIGLGLVGCSFLFQFVALLVSYLTR
jgi:hypothetical protein